MNDPQLSSTPLEATGRAARSSKTLPLAVLAALGLAAIPAPTHAAAPPSRTDRASGQLAKSSPAPVRQVVLGAPTRWASNKHQVRSGDTLSDIAARNGVSVSALRRANGISASESMIRPGQALRVPSGSRSTTSSGKSSSATANRSQRSQPQRSQSGSMRARSGDTLSDIAARNGVSVDALRRANPDIDPSRLQIGQAVRLPGASSRPATRQTTRQTTQQAVGNTFAGRTYAPEVTRAANANHATLANRSAPSRSAMKSKVAETARAHGVDPALALAIARQESGFNQRAVSPANAIGTMQVTPSAGRWASGLVGRQLDLTDPDDNVTAGVVVLQANLRAAASTDIGIAAYYQGLYSVRRNGMYTDTKGYVAAVKSHRAGYR